MSGAQQTEIIEFPFTKGQNEGTERAVLPVGEFSALRNARFRKNNLLGKRNGYTAVNSLDANASPLGNGAGRLSCLGPEFCVVDDRFYRRNTVQGAWTLAPVATGAQARRIPDRFPEFMPAPVLEMTTQESLIAAQDQEAGMTYFLGYVWTAEARALNGAGWVIHVDAIDPNTTDVIRSWDIELAGAANTDLPHVQLLTTLSQTLVLVTDSFTAGTKSAMVYYILTGVGTGFSGPSSTVCIESAVNYCTDAAHPDAIIMARVLTGSPATIRFSYFNVASGAHALDTAYAVGGNKTVLSVFQGSFQNIVRAGWLEGGNAMVQTRTVGLVLSATQNFTALIAGSIAPMLFADTSLGTCMAIATNASMTAINQCAVDSAGNFVAGATSTQLNYQPLSWPFSIEGRVYIWARYQVDSSLGVASLLRVALGSEYSSATTPGVWPLQATVDDRDVPHPIAVTHTAGPPLTTPLATPLGYLAVISYTRESFVSGGGISKQRRAYMLVPVQHRSGGVRYSPSCVVPCAGRQFVASAQPMWVDRISAYEAGYVQAPYITGSVGGAGGSLTANVTYSWTCLFQSTDSGLIDRSAPAVPATVAMGANTKCTLTITTDETGSRRQVSGRVYRTLANGSVFYFVGEFEATPGAGTTGTFTFIDTTADTDISQNEELFTQIGQEQPPSNFPACSFANTGGNRLWVGGGFTGNIVQASKQFVPHIAPEFVDDDAWRVSLPANCTGMAWLDQQVLFTQDRIYVVNGDGPDQAGEGFFTRTELPFNVGCIEPRSVVVSDLGIFFQSPRGLYLLPRGFGQPVPMDQVLDTLTQYPVVTASRGDFNSQGGADTSEQVVQWCAVADEEASSGVVITFDAAFKAFYVDTCGADFPACFLSGWSGDAVQAPALTTVGSGGASKWHPFRVQDASFDDEGLPIALLAATGDVRPWGAFGYGVVHRSGLLGVLRSACALDVTKFTDIGTRTATKTFTGIVPDYTVGSTFYVGVEQGSTEQKDVTTLRLQLAESSTTEGVSLIAMVIETGEQKQNFKRLSVADRIG